MATIAIFPASVTALRPLKKRFYLSNGSSHDTAKPAMRPHFAKLERSPEYFSWDPI